MMRSVTDIYGRRFKTLRVSLLSRCNLSCMYCTMGDDEVKENNHLSHAGSVIDLLETIKKLHDILQFEVIRLTGGEPLLYHDIIPVIKGIRQLGINDIKITTNGFLLDRYAQQMKDAGMQSINVSLDALDENVYFVMTKRNHVTKIIAGIDAALKAGLKVKINSVVMKGVNCGEILPLAEFAFEKKITIRFLEVMAMGYLHNRSEEYLFPQQAILNLMASKYKFTKMDRANSSTANYWRTDSDNIFGIIANESEPFCSDCDRLRLDSDGNIYGCLSNNHPVSVKDVADENVLIAKLREAMRQKQAVKFVGSKLSMLHIGG